MSKLLIALNIAAIAVSIGVGACLSRQATSLHKEASTAAYTACVANAAAVLAQADPGKSTATNPTTGQKAIKVRGAWIIVTDCGPKTD